MGAIALQRVSYRVRQFRRAASAYLQDLAPAQWAEIERILPPPAVRCFRSMPRPDQHHAWRVMTALRAVGHCDEALLQAALLHDAAKHRGGVTLFHRVGVVLIKAWRPALWQRWAGMTEPRRRDLRYPFWAHAHHPELGARLAADSGCGPLVVALIAHHQDGRASSSAEAELLTQLRSADDDN